MSGPNPDQVQASLVNWFVEHDFEAVNQLEFSAVKIPAVAYLDNRAIRFEGSFPTMEQLCEPPWNEEHSETKMSSNLRASLSDSPTENSALDKARRFLDLIKYETAAEFATDTLRISSERSDILERGRRTLRSAAQSRSRP
jgi:hypothetical protein